ncbi:hypothetical protein D9M71_802330 [compost metagenome]
MPTLAPSSTICAMRERMSPFSTKDAVINAVAVELCRAIVATRPVKNDRVGPFVPCARPARSFAPKARVTPSLTRERPNSSSATAPNRLTITIVDCMACLSAGRV